MLLKIANTFTFAALALVCVSFFANNAEASSLPATSTEIELSQALSAPLLAQKTPKKVKPVRQKAPPRKRIPFPKKALPPKSVPVPQKALPPKSVKPVRKKGVKPHSLPCTEHHIKHHLPCTTSDSPLLIEDLDPTMPSGMKPHSLPCTEHHRTHKLPCAEERARSGSEPPEDALISGEGLDADDEPANEATLPGVKPHSLPCTEHHRTHHLPCTEEGPLHLPVLEKATPLGIKPHSLPCTDHHRAHHLPCTETAVPRLAPQTR